jgi:hypothetical protein
MARRRWLQCAAAAEHPRVAQVPVGAAPRMTNLALQGFPRPMTRFRVNARRGDE